MKASLNTSYALCEVKTIGISDDLISKTENEECFSSSNQHTDEFTIILKSVFDKAASQLTSYAELSNTKKYIYLIVTYDDGFPFRKELNKQTRELFNTMNLSDIDLVIHNE
ncbi:MAG: hypothetical protein DHS20C09_17250 [marine bacterium B5-7]|nr:MAG: hypothetical protein DHS20C09_17250 [marine bacterium B5-7]